MTSILKHFFRGLFRRIKLAYNALHFRLRSLFGLWTKAPVRIDDYGGFARADYLYLKGRVLADRLITNSNEDSIWRIFMNNYRRFGSREIQGARVEVEFGENTFECVTDVEGYFVVNAPLSFLLEDPSRLWQRAFCRVTETPWQKVDVHRITEVLVISPDIRYAVISDVDDTILKTELTSLFKLKALYLTFLKNAAGRQAFHRGADFYQALERDLNAPLPTPFFYVSKSPWNLHDVLVDFMKINKLPSGPILLRDIGMPHEKRPKGYQGHKREHVEKFFNTFPKVQFLLIGDTVEADPKIYFSMARDYPDRVLAIYLREIDRKKRKKKLKKLLKKNVDKAPVCLFKSYEEAEADAIGRGFIKNDFSL